MAYLITLNYMDTAVTGKMNSQEKLIWSKVMLDDMVYVIRLISYAQTNSLKNF